MSTSGPVALTSQMFIQRRLTIQDLRSFQQEGYLLYGPILTPEGVDIVRSECMTAWNREKGIFSDDKSWLENTLLPNIHHYSDAVRKFYFDGPLLDVATQVIGPNIKGATSQLTFKLRGNIKPVQWHQDNGYGPLDPYNSISCLTALDDTDEQNGCLWIIPGSNHWGQQSHSEERHSRDSRFHNEKNIAVDESLARPIPMKAGDCLFFHCLTLHRSEGNRSERDRRILFFRYADADAVEVENDRKPRFGKLLRGSTRFESVRTFEAGL